jgi:ectoine hydroxylase-related dioxygenase (phytanoyl-CoA dioxygenase family)
MEATTYDLARPYPVNADQCAQYRRDGHILLRGVVEPEEIEYYSPLVTDLVDKHTRTRDAWVAADETQPMLEYVANVWQKSEEIREFVCARRFARIAARLMGVSGVRLYHDEALVKEPGGCPTPWHKDHYIWPLATHHTIKMWLALADVQIEMAAIRYATHTHRAGQFPEVSPSYESDQLFDRIIHKHNIPVVSCAMKAGDASFHSGEILHSTTANTTSERRKSLAVIYFADGTRVMTPNHEHRQADLAEFLPGLTPGDLAASDLNPLLYSSDEAE